MLAWIIVIAALVAVDQVTKLMAAHLLTSGVSADILPGIFRFTYVENRGAAFGMLSEHRWVFMIISVVAILALIVYLWKFRPDSIFACMAISMIIAGGIGNMIDRVALGYVIDFFDFYAFGELWPWVFNFADACVCVGGGILVIWLIFSMVAEAKAEKLKKAQIAENKTDKADGEQK